MRSSQEAFGAYYGAMTDDELLRVAANQESLVPVARAVLVDELRRRGKENLIPPAQRAKADSGLWWLPAVSDEESAKKAARYGAIAAFFQAAVTGIFAVISISTPLNYMRPNGILDALIFAFCGFMIQWKVSRIAAVGATVLYIADIIYGVIQEGRVRVGGVLWAVILLWAFISSILGTFAHHAHQERRHAARHVHLV
jgi:hypothetical protein